MRPQVRGSRKPLVRLRLPLGTCLRLMHLKSLYRPGYETLIKRVSDSIRWGLFAGAPYPERPPRRRR